MTRYITLSLILLTTLGCKTKEPGPLPPPEGDLIHLLDADPASVTSEQLLAAAEAADFRAVNYHVEEGIYWQAWRPDPDQPPSLMGSGGDSMLFTGMYTAACAYRYGVTRDSLDLAKAVEALRGLYILTHVTGTPGVLMRCAFPSDQKERFQYSHWGSRIQSGFVNDGPDDLDDPFNPGQKLPKMTYYTRVTRDQITGLIYGLSVFWAVVTTDDVASASDRAEIERARRILAVIVDDVYRHLRKHDFKIRDENGRNDTRSDSISHDLLKLSLMGIYRRTIGAIDPSRVDRIQDKYDDIFDILRIVGFYPSDPFNKFSNAQQYYAWNLRFTRAAAVWLCATDEEREILGTYITKWMFSGVKGHKNAWFTLVYAMANPGDKSAARDGELSLKSWSLRPAKGWPSPVADGWNRDYEPPNVLERAAGTADDRVLWPHLRKPTGYWIWQKDPWDAGRTRPVPDYETGTLDMLLPYWMGRYYGLVR